MKRINQKIYIGCLLSLLLGTASSCKNEFEDPSRASLPVALGSTQGLSAVAVGVQRTYSLGLTSVLYNSINASGFSTNEFKLLNSGNIPELQFTTGGSSVDGTNTVLFNIWATSLKVIDESDKVIEGAEALGDKGFASGLIGYVTVFKALALGNLAEFWQNAPVATGKQAAFLGRMDVYKTSIAAIDKALNAIAADGISPQFYTSSVATFDIVNTLHALKARYALFSNDYVLAMTEANLVNLTSKNTLNFDNANPNVLGTTVISNNVFQPLDANLGLPATLAPDPADKRLPFYTTMIGTPPTLRMKGFATSTTAAIPIFLPGEMILIKAEAYARQNPADLGNALTELNKVVTKTTDVYGIGADLPQLTGPFTQPQLLELIYKHRCIEMYASGLKLEDMRRFNRPESEMKRNFMPYPFQERDNNSNTPADPTF